MTEYRRDESAEKSFVVGAFLGAAAGVIATLFLAPESGKKTRKKVKATLKDVGEKLDDLEEKIAEEGIDWRKNFSDIATKVADEVHTEAQKALHTAAESVSQASESVMEKTEIDMPEPPKKSTKKKSSEKKSKTTSSGRKPRFFKGT